MEETIPVDHRLKIKESEKLDKYQDFLRETKMLRNMKVTVILIAVGEVETVEKSL